ncbi:MAG: hypothetical protein JNK15_22250, partial [Planctomycetes bacterium]|nr:hypothetical protein [Planctomycetota bacterium]
LAAHPLLWWLARDVRFHAELLADDAAAAATGRERYARDLLDLAERAEPELAAAGTVPVFHRPSEFFRRIQMLLQREGRLSAPVSLVRRSVQTLAAFALVGVAAATLGVPAAAQEPHRRELVAQNDALRAQIDALHTELANLRALLDEHKQKQARDQVPAAVPSPNAHSGSDGATPDGNEALRVLDQLARVGDMRPTTEEAHAAIRALQRLAEGPRTDADADPVRVNELLEKAAASADANSTEAQDAKRVVLPEMYRRYYDQYLKAFPARLPVPGSANADPQPAPRARTSADDVAELVSRCLDLKGDLELAEMEAAEAKEQHEAGVVSGLDNKRVQLKFATLQRKYAAVRVLVRGEIEATQQEIEVLAALRDQTGSAAQLARAKARLEALQAAN